MPLTNAQYDALMRTYEETRLGNRHILEARRQEVYEKIPAYRALDVSLSDESVERARRLIGGEKDALREQREQTERIRKKKRELLTDHGYPEDYLDPIYVCANCRDTGYVNGEKCRCLKQAAIRLLYSQSNLESVLSEENFDNLSYEYYNDADVERMRQIVEECRSFARDFDSVYENLLLNGSVGVGKTYLTNCIAKDLLESGHSVIYFTSFKLFDLLAKYAFHSSDAGDDITAMHEDVFSCDLLIIDDLGTEMTNSFVSSQLFAILNERNIRKKSTIISTNLSLELLNEKYSERNFSRIFGYYKMLRIEIDDIRIAMRRMKNAQNRK
ncbi:MAG: ATP-binding protein [Lachnospiraceae bacterium]|nr:ATP-binding protein [Lachnospiraceae bacterium]